MSAIQPCTHVRVNQTFLWHGAPVWQARVRCQKRRQPSRGGGIMPPVASRQGRAALSPVLSFNGEENGPPWGAGMPFAPVLEAA